MKTKSALNNLFAVLATSVVLAAGAAHSANAADDNATGQTAQRQENVVTQTAQVGGSNTARATAGVSANRSQSGKLARFDTNDPSYQRFLREVLERSGA